MTYIKGIPKNQYFREYYHKRVPQKYCEHCKINFGLKFKHYNTLEHKINLCRDYNLNIEFLK